MGKGVVTRTSTGNDDCEHGALRSSGSPESHFEAARALLAAGEPIRAVALHLVAAGRGDETWANSALRDAAAESIARGRENEAYEFLELAVRGTADRFAEAELTDLDWWLRPAGALRDLVELAGSADLPASTIAVLARRLAWHGRIDEAAALLAVRPDPGIQGAITDAWLAHLYPGAFPVRAGTPAVEEVAATHPWLRESADPAAVLQGLLPHRDTLEPLEMSLLALDAAAALEVDSPWFADLLAAARRSTSRIAEALLTAARARVELRRGELRTAEDSAETALRLLSPAGWGVLIGLPLATLVESLTEQGRHDEVAVRLRHPVPRAISRTPYGLMYLRARGHHFLATGRARAALGEFLAAGEIQSTWDVDYPGLAPWLVDAARAHLALGRPDAARELAGRQLREPLHAQPVVRAAAKRVLAATLDPARRPSLLREAIVLAEAGGDRLELARCLMDLSLMFTEAGEPHFAHGPLRRAWRSATTSGSALLREELLVRGLSEPSADLGGPGPGQLSDAERRVAELAAQGYKNREIARSLFLTASTVEQHLTRVYRKLGVRRRSGLAAVPGLVPDAGFSRPYGSRPPAPRPEPA